MCSSPRATRPRKIQGSRWDTRLPNEPLVLSASLLGHERCSLALLNNYATLRIDLVWFNLYYKHKELKTILT
jgi:hypothetical protein